VYNFDATYDEAGAAHAERLFFLRSISELRRWTTFGPPVLLAAGFAAAAAFGASSWVTILLSILLALSIAGPVFLFVARPIAVKRLARKYPVRRVVLTFSAIEITAEGRQSVVPWQRIKHVWSAGEYLLLVLGKFGYVSIPRHSLPPGANEFIFVSFKSAA